MAQWNDYHSRVLWRGAVTSLPPCERTFSGWLEDREALSAGGRSAQDAARSRITRGVHHPNACPDPPRYDRGLGRDVARRNRPAAEQTPLPNVSYDATRELYHLFNRAFIRAWKAKTGETLVVNRSHNGSGWRRSRTSAVGTKHSRRILPTLGCSTASIRLENNVPASLSVP
jgi:hypothetical protein